MKFHLFLAFAVLVITFSCQKSNHSDPINPGLVEVTAGVSGRVIDDKNQPVNAAAVTVGTTTTTTDINGNFTVTNTNLNKNAGLVKVEKEGFFLGSRTIIVNPGAINNVTIQLITKKIVGTVSTSGGSVTVPTGGSIAFTSNSFTNSANNTAYTGMVSVSAFFINPEASNFKEIMPGALRGINASNEETGLQSFGMMAVELNGASGEKLQLASGKTATIILPIPTSLQTIAPATIPLWKFNDSSGLWKEEGTATKQGNNYVGTVGHFSFWNCDYPYGLVDFKSILKDQNGNALNPAQVIIRVSTDTTTIFGYGYTDNTGFVGGKIPINKKLSMNVYNKCNTLLYTKDIGPFTSTADLGTITITTATSLTLHINGNLVNCNASPVTNGFVDINIDNVHNRVMVSDSKGNFSLDIIRCNNMPATAVLTAYDLATNEIGTPTNLSVSSGTSNAGQLTACGKANAEFVNYTLNNVFYSYTKPADSVYMYNPGPWYTVAASSFINGNYADEAYMNFIATTTGTATLKSLQLLANTKHWALPSPSTLTITEFGAIGSGYVAGNFSATLKDSSGNQTTQFNYTFRVKRTQ